MNSFESPARPSTDVSPRRDISRMSPPAPQRSFDNASETSAERASTLTSVLDQMDHFFRSDNRERQLRLQQLEDKQAELQRLCDRAVEEEQRAAEAAEVHRERGNAAAAHAAAEEHASFSAEVNHLTERCNRSMAELMGECREATEEAGRLRVVNERLLAQLEEKESKYAALNGKMEQLAKNVVKAIRERNHFEEQLEVSRAENVESRRAHDNVVTELRSKDAMYGDVEDLKDSLRQRTKDLAMANDECTKLTAMVEKSTNDQRKVKREFLNEREALVRQLTEQLSDVVVERDEAIASAAQSDSTSERLADELQAATQHSRILEEKLGSAERALQTERAARATLEREVTALKSAQGVAPYGNSAMPYTSSESSAALRTQMAHLQGLLDSAVLEKEESLKHAEDRVQSLTSLNEQLAGRCQAYETTITELRKELAHVGRERTHASLSGQRWKQLLVQLQQDAGSTAEVIVTTRSDAEEAVANAQDDLSLRFAQQALADFAAIAHFFASIRRLDLTDSPLHQMGPMHPNNTAVGMAHAPQASWVGPSVVQLSSNMSSRSGTAAQLSSATMAIPENDARAPPFDPHSAERHEAEMFARQQLQQQHQQQFHQQPPPSRRLPLVAPSPPGGRGGVPIEAGLADPVVSTEPAYVMQNRSSMSLVSPAA